MRHNKAYSMPVARAMAIGAMERAPMRSLDTSQWPFRVTSGGDSSQLPRLDHCTYRTCQTWIESLRGIPSEWDLSISSSIRAASQRGGIRCRGPASVLIELMLSNVAQLKLGSASPVHHGCHGKAIVLIFQTFILLSQWGRRRTCALQTSPNCTRLYPF